MNAAVRAAVRIAVDQGHIVLGVRRGIQGLIDDDMQEMEWMSVNGWASQGGSELGTNRVVPNGPDFYRIAKTIEKRDIQALLVIGGWEAYQSAYRLSEERKNFPAYNIPIVCLPASIDNNLPGTELSIGADTALNSIVTVVDKIKQSAVAERRVYIVEVMGRRCGYLAMMSGLASGAERIYVHEEGVTLKGMEEDLEMLIEGFKEGKRVGLIIRNEEANRHLRQRLHGSRSSGRRAAACSRCRESILGHLQQGGDPSPFDRIQATSLARRCVGLPDRAGRWRRSPPPRSSEWWRARWSFTPIEDLPRMIDEPNRRPKNQWWLGMRTINNALARSGPSQEPAKEAIEQD